LESYFNDDFEENIFFQKDIDNNIYIKTKEDFEDY